MMRTRVLLLLLASSLPAGAVAQAPVPNPADSLAGLGPLPTSEEIRRSLELAGGDEASARVAIDQIRTQRERTQYLVDILKSEISTLGKRLDLAKKEKRADTQKSLEGEKKGMEARLRVLERWRDVHDAGIRAAEARRDAARETRKVGEAEQQLGDMRSARLPNATDTTARVMPMDESLVKQVRKVAEARRDDAEARRALAERQRELADRQRELLDAQLALKELSGSGRTPGS